MYIDANVMMGGICSDPASAGDCFLRQAAAYYQAVDVIDSSFDPNDPNAFYGDPFSTDPSKRTPSLLNHFTPERGTFEQWLSYWGFSADNTAPVSGELRAQYFNNGDLQYGRDMHCRSQTFPVRASKVALPNKAVAGASQPLGDAVGYACYVINSSNSSHPGPLNDSYWYAANRCPGHRPECDATDPLLSIISRPWLNSGRIIVAMEVIATPVSGGWQFGDVSFIAYASSGAGVNGQPNLVAFMLDSQEEPPPGAVAAGWQKPIPGACMACHGGRYQPATANSPARVIGANFLPFDTSSELFRSDKPAITETAQRDVIRQLNALVQKTQPPQRAISDLISGWYAWCGGVGKPGCYSDPVNHPFIPGDPSLCSSGTFCRTTCDANRPASEQTCGWWTGQPVNSSQKSGFNIKQFYSEVAAPLCRTCHVALADRFNVQDFDEWKSRAYDPVETARTMPFAEVPYLKFARNMKGPSNIGARDFFDYFFASSGTGSPRQQCLAQCSSAQACCTSSCDSSCGKLGASCTSSPQVQSCKNQCAASQSQCQSACPAF
ncbi:MAG TPA: hypothetical protein VFK87_06235 [Steroidobacteraceae bacterium]|nr:hypothetical protein [Steroidobacteraceae bacterium]